MGHSELKQSDFYVPGASATDEATQIGSMQELDHALERLEETLGSLERTMGPILNQYGVEEKLSIPEPEPASQIRGRAVRLHYLVSQLEALIHRVDL